MCNSENLTFRSRSYAKNEEYRLSYWHIKIPLETMTDTYSFMKKLHKCWTSKNAILFLILLEFLFFYLQHGELPPQKKHLRALLLIFQFLKFFPKEKNKPGIPHSSDGWLIGMLFPVNFSQSGKFFRLPESFTNNPKCQMGRGSLLQD